MFLLCAVVYSYINARHAFMHSLHKASTYMNMVGPPPQSLLCSSLDHKYTDVARPWC